MSKNSSVLSHVRKAFKKADIELDDWEVREYPDECIVVVRVASNDMAGAIEIANSLDSTLSRLQFKGFVTVKKSAPAKKSSKSRESRIGDLSDSRVLQLVNLLTARSRTTELQPSLEYIRDAKNNLASAISARNHLLFGRRGSGKTALLVETKHVAEKTGALSVWMNLQTFRHEKENRVFLFVAQKICQLVQSHFRSKHREPRVLNEADRLSHKLESLIEERTSNDKSVRSIIPSMQNLVRRFLDTVDVPLYVFLDDFHYLEKCDQPLLLDMLHGCVRDCNAWLKVAAIQHLTRWFDPGRQLGLQSGHDAATISLDITLQDPTAAKLFMEEMLLSYTQHCGISSFNHIYTAKGALDRLVLASGAVPRDYLTLCSTSIQEAQRRQGAKRVGVQDVNKAAGDAKQKKIDELEDDAATSREEGSLAISTLEKVRRFCLEETNWTYFRIEFQEKESHLLEYTRLQVLTDLRLVHLVEPSLSDERKAGHRSEVYMLDLSQFAGQRLKRKLSVLDFVDGNLVLKRTGTQKNDIVGDTPNKRLSILRRSPQMGLDYLT